MAKAALKTPADKQVAWFVYTRKNGQLGYHKYIIEGDLIHADTKKYYEGFELCKFPINQQQWELDLEELKRLFPLPPELRKPHDAQ